MAKAQRHHPGKIFLIIAAIVVAVIVLCVHFKKVYTHHLYVAKQKMTTAPAMVSADFTCSGGKTINATFVNGSGPHVELDLSDGRSINLPQVISADGGRYANWNESFIFWNTGNTAFIEEDGKAAYENCVTKSN